MESKLDITELSKVVLAAAKEFGGEAEANEDMGSWSKDDRESIAFYYGVEKWNDIPIEHQSILLLEYRKGERLQRAETYASSLVTEYTLEWSPADWEGETYKELVEKAEELLDEEPSLYGNMFNAKMAFERFMGW